jgi:hypothetical protein
MAKRFEDEDVAALERRRQAIKLEITELGDLRPGSLVERYRRCGKASCRCMREGERGHGPAWSLTRSLSGRTVTRLVPSGQAVDMTRAHLAEYRRLRRLLHEFLELSERLCEVRLRRTVEPDPEE